LHQATDTQYCSISGPHARMTNQKGCHATYFTIRLFPHSNQLHHQREFPPISVPENCFAVLTSVHFKH
jgi:hypothetical protein